MSDIEPVRADSERRSRDTRLMIIFHGLAGLAWLVHAVWTKDGQWSYVASSCIPCGFFWFLSKEHMKKFAAFYRVPTLFFLCLSYPLMAIEVLKTSEARHLVVAFVTLGFTYLVLATVEWADRHPYKN